MDDVELEPTARRIWLDDKEGLCVIVDEIDYAWAIKWRWHATPNSRGKKFYATRNTRDRRAGRQMKIYLHKEILKRMGERPPSPKHNIGDHMDGDSLNCRRDNLRYATTSMNAKNLRGVHKRQSALRV